MPNYVGVGGIRRHRTRADVAQEERDYDNRYGRPDAHIKTHRQFLAKQAASQPTQSPLVDDTPITSPGQLGYGPATSADTILDRQGGTAIIADSLDPDLAARKQQAFRDTLGELRGSIRDQNLRRLANTGFDRPVSAGDEGRPAGTLPATEHTSDKELRRMRIALDYNGGEIPERDLEYDGDDDTADEHVEEVASKRKAPWERKGFVRDVLPESVTSADTKAAKDLRERKIKMLGIDVARQTKADPKAAYLGSKLGTMSDEEFHALRNTTNMPALMEFLQKYEQLAGAVGSHGEERGYKTQMSLNDMMGELDQTPEVAPSIGDDAESNAAFIPSDDERMTGSELQDYAMARDVPNGGQGLIQLAEDEAKRKSSRLPPHDPRYQEGFIPQRDIPAKKKRSEPLYKDRNGKALKVVKGAKLSRYDVNPKSTHGGRKPHSEADSVIAEIAREERIAGLPREFAGDDEDMDTYSNPRAAARKYFYPGGPPEKPAVPEGMEATDFEVKIPHQAPEKVKWGVRRDASGHLSDVVRESAFPSFTRLRKAKEEEAKAAEAPAPKRKGGRRKLTPEQIAADKAREEAYARGEQPKLVAPKKTIVKGKTRRG